MKICLLIFTLLLGCAYENDAKKKAPISTQEVTYTHAGKSFVGYVAYPREIQSPRPAILVVHEWWGQTDYPRKRAEMLARLGYVAFAVDMYGGRKQLDHPKNAKAFMMKAMKDAKTVGGRFKAALMTLSKRKEVDANNMAAIGYCFGGAVVLEAAKQNAALKGIVSFHGGLDTPTPIKKNMTIKPKILILNGKEDPFVSKESIAKFRKQMRQANAKFEFINIPDAVHGYTNPDATENGKKFNLPLAYNKKADEESWMRMRNFLDNIFKK